MSLKLHFFTHILFSFKKIFETYSKEHGEIFHQDIQQIEKRCRGRWDSAVMGNYMWSLISEDMYGHERKARSTVHF